MDAGQIGCFTSTEKCYRSLFLAGKIGKIQIMELRKALLGLVVAVAAVALAAQDANAFWGHGGWGSWGGSWGGGSCGSSGGSWGAFVFGAGDVQRTGRAVKDSIHEHSCALAISLASIAREL